MSAHPVEKVHVDLCLASIAMMTDQESRCVALGALADAIMPDPEHILTLKDMAGAHGVSERIVRYYCRDVKLLKPLLRGGVLYFTLRDARFLGDILGSKRLGLTVEEIRRAA